MEKNANFYKMNNIADIVSSRVIYAHMSGKKFELQEFDYGVVALFDKNKKLLYGRTLQDVDFNKSFYMRDGIFTLVSQRAAEHLNVKYIVVQSSQCVQNIKAIQNQIAYTVVITAFLIILIAIFLSYIFLKPLRDKMQEIEEFVKDTTHELNTPITALMMSTSRLKNKKEYDEKVVKNISISTKQLYDIYSSLSFLSFDSKSEAAIELDFSEVVKEDIAYFGELLERKNISLIKALIPCRITIAPTKAKMLINNLLSNAIKYSNPNSKITITTTQNSFSIEDEGIGIAKEKLEKIFQRFVRANSYAGGFGVGLSIVEGIIEEYGYTIEIDSKEGKGTKIYISFNP